MGNRSYWWVVSTKPDQKTMWVVGKADSKEQADQLGYEQCEGEFQCWELQTPNVARATSQLKAKRLKANPSDLSSALMKASHKAG